MSSLEFNYETDTKTQNWVKFSGGAVKSKTMKSGSTFTNYYVMPDVEDVEIIEKDGKVKKIIVSFMDGSSEKAVLSEGDTYSLEQGISICIAKKLLSDKTAGSGSAVYNKIISHAFKVIKYNREQEAKEKAEAERIKAKREKMAKKKASKKAKLEGKLEEKEEEIDIISAALLRTLREYKKLSSYLDISDI